MNKSNFWYFLVVILILITFLFLRLYRIQTSLLFFNDMGRDFLELYEWQQTKIPPLLGPQTSALSFNQSPFYYYIFFPVFLLTGHSPYSTLITLIILCLSVYIWGAVYCYRHSQFRQRFLIVSLLIALQPQIIIQNRFIWNPSFLPLFISLALFVYPELISRLTPKRLHLFVIGLSLAISFNLSAIPLSLAALTYGAFFWRRQTLKVIGWFLFYLILWYTPVIFFELRHHFALSYLLIHGQRPGIQSLSLLNKATAMYMYLIGLPKTLGGIFWLIFAVGLYSNFKLRPKIYPPLQHYLVVFTLSVCLTLLMPSDILAHYIFGSLTSLFFVISAFSLPYALSLMALVSLYWLKPAALSNYFAPARRTVRETQMCYQVFCQKYPEPIYVSVQAGFQPYHNGPEHRYLMLESGCDVQKIENGSEKANLMAVVADDSAYEHGKTAYNELTLFGYSNVRDIITCQENLKIYVLEKN